MYYETDFPSLNVSRYRKRTYRMLSSHAQNRRMIFLILYLTYICAGIISILPGPTLSLLAANTGVPLEVAGWIFTSSATGFMLGVVIAGIISQRFGPKYVLMSGLAIMSCSGVVTPLTRDFSLLLSAQFVQGIGFGFLDVTVSMIVALTFGNAHTDGHIEKPETRSEEHTSELQ